MVDTQDDVEQRQAGTDGAGSRFLRFWSTMPGVLTALAGVITAAGTIYLQMDRDAGDNPEPRSDPTPVTTTVPQLAPPPVPAPTPPVTRLDDLIPDCAQGDEGACALVLDALVGDCLNGDGWSCDVVYEVTDVGSELERLGATCGYEFATPIYAGQCESVL